MSGDIKKLYDLLVHAEEIDAALRASYPDDEPDGDPRRGEWCRLLDEADSLIVNPEDGAVYEFRGEITLNDFPDFLRERGIRLYEDYNAIVATITRFIGCPVTAKFRDAIIDCVETWHPDLVREPQEQQMSRHEQI